MLIAQRPTLTEEVVEEDRLMPELRALRKREGAAGLDVRPRQAMEKNLT